MQHKHVCCLTYVCRQQLGRCDKMCFFVCFGFDMSTHAYKFFTMWGGGGGGNSTICCLLTGGCAGRCATTKLQQCCLSCQGCAAGPENSGGGDAKQRTFVDSFLDVVVHAKSGPGVEVTAQFKGSDHGLALGHVGQDTQLQLPIVCHHQGVSLGHICCERLPDLWNA